MTKINNCSCCGGNVTLSKKTIDVDADGYLENWEFKCDKCGSRWWFPADGFCDRKYYSEEEVINIWNNRNISDEMKSDSTNV